MSIIVSDNQQHSDIGMVLYYFSLCAVLFLLTLSLIQNICCKLFHSRFNKNIPEVKIMENFLTVNISLYFHFRKFLCLCKCLVGFWKGYFNQKRCRRRNIFLISLQKCPFCTSFNKINKLKKKKMFLFVTLFIYFSHGNNKFSSTLFVECDKSTQFIFLLQIYT